MRLIKPPFFVRYPTLKNFLKAVYPFVQSLQSFKPPKFRLPSLPFPRFRRRLVFLFLTLLLTTISLFSTLTYIYVFKDLPSPRSLSSAPLPLTTHIRDRNGIELYKVYTTQNRTLIKLGHLPQSLKQAVIAIEDKQFYAHKGFSFSGTARAAYRILKGERLEGGSTITQQLVKTSLLTPERTLIRKARELALALLVERMFSKDQILEMYLNRVGFGGSSYGVEEAAQMYFGKSASDLDLAQAALLAGLPASPTTFSPYGSHPELAKIRQKEVLSQMITGGFITWDEAESASIQELKFQPPKSDIQAPHFVMYIKDLLAKQYGPQILEQGGLDVITSLDLKLQDKVQKIVTAEVSRLKHLQVTNGSALVTNPQTGEILAMIGSTDYFNTAADGNVNVTLSPRQPGSSIKPINYALGLTKGFTPATLIDDSPITYRFPGSPPYSPVNYDRRYHGRITVRQALASSYNIPAVKILAANGVANMIDLGKQMGITTWDDTNRFGLSLTLGGGEVKMVDMAVVYGAFANQGLKVDLHPILSVRDASGKLLDDYTCQTALSCPSKRVLDPKVAYLISDILSDNVARTPTFGSHSDLYIPGQTVAVKTGTTNNLRDNWTIGFTPNRLVAVWVGNNDNTPMSYIASGVTGASPIWRKITDEILTTHPSAGFFPPENLVRANICLTTGTLGCPACPGRPEYFLPGTQPQISCSHEQIAKINESRILDGVKTTPTPTPRPLRIPRLRIPLPRR